MERVVTAILPALGIRELSGQIHTSSAGRHENVASGCIVMKSVVLTFDSVNARPYPSPVHYSTSRLERSTVVWQWCATLGMSH